MNHLYVHVPFCDEICAYCDFFRVKKHDGLIAGWLQALEAELAQYSYQYIDTIYIGGGTPSSLSVAQLAQLLELLLPFGNHVKEYTIEANPESCSLEKLLLCEEYGVNRISLGVQTLDEKVLRLIHRRHTAADVQTVIANIHKAGISNITIDMMYGLPYQDTTMWEAHLKEVTTWPIHHISMYSLTIEEHSEFGRQHQSLIDNELEGELYEKGVAILEEAGFFQYEVSNFAKPGFASQHNLGYWNVEDYVGAGCGAHGSVGSIRYENTERMDLYLQRKFREKEELISVKERMFEAVMLGLRKKQGIALTQFEARFHVKLEKVYKDAIEANQKEGLLIMEAGYLRTTPKGLVLLHSVLLAFMN